MKKKIPRALPVKIVAPNGMTIITREDHSTPIVSFCVYFPGGGIHERSDRMGLTHLMQRLLIKGTATRSSEAIAREIEFLGAHISPFTGKENFGVSMSAVSRHFYQGVEIFADCIMNPTFEEEELEKERKNIILEIEKRKDDTLGHCLDLCEERLFGNNPYGYAIIGKKESVEQITRDDVVNWHETFYAPERMIVSLVGDVKADVVHRRFLEAFDRFKSSHRAIPGCSSVKPVIKHEVVSEEREKKQVAVALGFLAPPLLSREYYSFKVLDFLLSGMGSRLFINLRDVQGLAYLVSSTYTPRKCMGSFKAYMQTSHEKHKKAVDGLLRELCSLRDEQPSITEIERIKHYMIGLHDIGLQKKWSQASKMGYYEVMGLGYDFPEKYPGRVRRVTPGQVKKAVREYIDTEKFTCAMIVPKG